MEDDRTGRESQIKIRTTVSARTAANIPAVSLQNWERQLGKCYREMAGDADKPKNGAMRWSATRPKQQYSLLVMV